ncbi:hypothetical protein ACO0LD_23930 [Undibacterium sp. Ji83W]|uniref:hypothetical protein n=1 Tax=Undibacterium sp. Ji83W TaxID=3413043 RepID=UPI003BF12796
MQTFLSWLSTYPYAYNIVGFAFVLVGFILVFFRVSRVLKGGNKGDNKSFIDYLLIWPIVIEQHKKTATKNSNKFIVWGLLVMVMLVVGDIVFLK